MWGGGWWDRCGGMGVKEIVGGDSLLGGGVMVW